MVGSNKTRLALIGVAILVVVALLALFLFNNDDGSSKAKNADPQKSSSTTTRKQSSTTLPNQESTSTSLALDGISISISTPVPNQVFDNESIIVRAIIEGTTSGTCKLKFSKQGSNDVEFEAPVVAAPTYYTCEGFDVAQNNFAEKGEWILELSVTSKNDNSGSEKRKISIL